MSYENLRVYQAVKALRAEVDRLGEPADKRLMNAYKHLNEALDSISNNIAEGSASRYPHKQRSFYDIANGSTLEARSSLQMLDFRGAWPGKSVQRSVSLCQVVWKMLREMIASLPDKRKQETPSKSDVSNRR